MAEAAGKEAQEPRLEWDSGTAYDFFTSLWALHEPEELGLRPSWAAGVRSRLSEETRRFMGDVSRFVCLPIQWVHSLPAPRDSRAAIQELERLEDKAVPEALILAPGMEKEGEADAIVRRTLSEGRWDPSDVDTLLRECCGQKLPGKRDAGRERAERWLGWLSRPAEFGDKYRRGMTEFRESFFREEERRIGPVLERSLQAAQERSRSLRVADLVEELSQGIRRDDLLSRPRLMLIPCYWCSPRILHGHFGKDCTVVLFGARPPDASLVPEDEVPVSLSLALTALADGTRLNILRILREESLTQAQLARRLRLRPSTISHHLKSLRMAALITVIDTGDAETRYATRVARVQELGASLGSFLKL